MNETTQTETPDTPQVQPDQPTPAETPDTPQVQPDQPTPAETPVSQPVPAPPAPADDPGSPVTDDSVPARVEPTTVGEPTGTPTPPVAPAPSPAVPKPSAIRPGPPPRSVAALPTAVPAATVPESSGQDAARYGRVDEDGTVWVTTPDGERSVGSYPGAGRDEALAYFARKYDEILAQIVLFEQRLSATDLTPGELESGLTRLRDAVKEPNAVGDLAALTARVEALAPVAAERRKEADAARTAARDEARVRRTALVEQAEQLAAIPPEKTQWRSEGQQMKDLFEQWQTEQKSSGRLDRPSEDELWKRFSHARTSFDRKRRQHFAHLDETQTEAKAAKEKLVKEAEALQSGTDWGPTAQAYKRLMDRWRTAGRANRKDDDALWQRFRAAQDTFFAARHAAQAEQDAEFSANLEVKQALLTQAEALVPVTDLAAAKSALRQIQDRWETAGKVPRGDMDRIERRMRAVEQTVRDAEDARWTSTNPEARARAKSAVDQLEAAIADLEGDLKKATDQGKAKRIAEAQASLDARREWLEQARKALADFGG